jgi:hypothetical protein
MHLTQDRDQWQVVVNTVMNLRVHKSGQFLDYVTISFSRRTVFYGVSYKRANR